MTLAKGGSPRTLAWEGLPYLQRGNPILGWAVGFGVVLPGMISTIARAAPGDPGVIRRWWQFDQVICRSPTHLQALGYELATVSIAARTSSRQGMLASPHVSTSRKTLSSYVGSRSSSSFGVTPGTAVGRIASQDRTARTTDSIVPSCVSGSNPPRSETNLIYEWSLGTSTAQSCLPSWYRFAIAMPSSSLLNS